MKTTRRDALKQLGACAFLAACSDTIAGGPDGGPLPDMAAGSADGATGIDAAPDTDGATSTDGAVQPGAAPYRWYTALDKAIIPFHAAAGEWGPQSVIKEADAPQGTLTEVTAANMAELITHLQAGGRRITLTGDCMGTAGAETGMQFSISDCDIVVPVGRRLGRITFGSYVQSTSITRLRVRGSTVGAMGTGGQVHSVRFTGTVRDLIIEGVDVTGPRRRNGTEQMGALTIDQSPTQHYNNARFALHNCRIAAGCFAGLLLIADITMCNNSMVSGLEDLPLGNEPGREGWGFRFTQGVTGNIVVYENDFRGRRYHRLRWHPNGNALHNYWVRKNTFVDRVENRIFWVDAAAGGGNGIGAATWFEHNLIVASNTGNPMPPAIEGGDQARAYVRNNGFQSNTFLSDGNIVLTGTVATVKAGNTYAALPGADPAWGGPGDPTTLDWDIG